MPVFPGIRLFGSVLRVDHGRWEQTVADLRHLALTAAHPRSRERFLALHEIAQGSCATAVAERTGRRAQTVMGWLHAYNEHGPEALTYQRTLCNLDDAVRVAVERQHAGIQRIARRAAEEAVTPAASAPMAAPFQSRRPQPNSGAQPLMGGDRRATRKPRD